MNLVKDAKATIYKKISRLILLSSLFFFGLFFAIYYYTVEQEKEVYHTSKAHYDNEITSLIELESETNMSNIIDIVYWDEFVDYLKNHNEDWFDENITSSVETYKSDYLGIYSVDGKFIRKSANEKIKSVDFIPKGVFQKINEKRVVKFYVKIPEGYVQVFGASVHSTADIYKKQTKPSGYFFIVKLLDANYFKNLERINNSKIGLFTTYPTNNDVLTITRELKDWDGKTINTMVFIRPFDVSFHITKNILILLIVTYFISVMIFLMFSRKWIYKPLNLIKNILEKGNENDMESLKHIPGEFRYIGTLLQEKAEQKKMLEVAKAKAEESDRLKSSFLTNISHEIRTPMNAIAGFSDLLLGAGLKDSERLEYIKIINNSGKNLVSIIDDLIEMSKIDTNQVAPNYARVNVDACLDELYQAIKISIPEHKAIDFQIRKPINGLSDKVITDGVKLKQILSNLITNAIKYTENGYVLFGYEADETASILEFIIQDSGIGIDVEHHKKIFDRFHRIENDFTIKAGGLGLGLAISKAYVQMLGGDITFESSELKGTTFSFTIPLKYANRINCADLNVVASDDLGNKTINILVAEDDNINFLLIQKILHLNRHTIIRAKDGQEAVDICRENKDIDLVLMDIKMPVMDGYQALEEIRTFRPYLPVIAQTAYASADDEKKIIQFGFRAYISKPIKKERLFEIINEVMKTKYEI